MLHGKALIFLLLASLLLPALGYALSCQTRTRVTSCSNYTANCDLYCECIGAGADCAPCEDNPYGAYGSSCVRSASTCDPGTCGGCMQDDPDCDHLDDPPFWKGICDIPQGQLTGTCKQAPVCPEGFQMGRHVAGPEGTAWGIAATEIFECKLGCVRSEGWHPLPPAPERCENIGKPGICCEKLVYPFCGDGVKQGKEQCERGIPCTNPAFPKCVNCMCRSGPRIIPGGDGSWTFGTTVCVGEQCLFKEAPVSGDKVCITDADCALDLLGQPQHKECNVFSQCVMVSGEGQQGCLIDEDCGAPLQTDGSPVADATVGDSTVGQNQGCSNDFYPSEASVAPGSVVTLHSDRDSADFDCLPSHDPYGAPICNEREETHPICSDQDTLAQSSFCCFEYEWYCAGADCPVWDNPDEDDSKLTRDKNPRFGVQGSDVGKEFEFHLFITDSDGKRSSSSRVLVSVVAAEFGPIISPMLIPNRLTRGTSFSTAEAEIDFVGSGAPGAFYIKVRIMDRVSGQRKGNEHESENASSFPRTFDFSDPDGAAGQLPSELGEETLPIGNYRLVVELYDSTNNPLGSNFLNFSIVPSGISFVPETTLFLIPPLAAIALFLLWKRR